ncbi:hypothetical protein [Neorhizobium galegae]|uniref:hypothetical protein n=1 Tax=Neorhizobium galegae TaxID=399 RepID=UPI002106C41F|nr:hypothetical protein [Neorhizobium galegae]MCQ1856132.1 hypothetical protein [Neorhizobium galegae]
MSRDRVLLHMWGPYRESLIEQLDFFKSQADTRLLSQFENLSEEAEKRAEDVLETMGKHFDPDRHDLSDFYDAANDASIHYYGLLDGMRDQAVLSVAAGLYHQFEIRLRDFLATEFQKYFHGDKLKQKLWRQVSGNIFDLLEGCGWDIRSEPFFAPIDACRLVVNVYKHGEGPSLDELKKKYPQFLRSIWGEGELDIMLRLVDHTHLTVKRDDVDRFHEGLRLFWLSAPEYTMFSHATDVPEWVVNAINADVAERELEAKAGAHNSPQGLWR